MVQTYVERLAEIRQQYEPRIMNVLKLLARGLRRTGYLVGDPAWRGVTDYMWELRAASSRGETFTIRIRIDESEDLVAFVVSMHEVNEVLPSFFSRPEHLVDPMDLKAVGLHFIKFEAAVTPEALLPHIRRRVSP